MDTEKRLIETARIVITPDMIEAGALAISEHDLELETSEEGAQRVFRAMIQAAPDRLYALFARTT